MKKLRVFQTVKINRIVPGFPPKNPGTVLLFLLLIPYIITFLFGNLKEGNTETLPLSNLEDADSMIFVNNETAFGVETVPLEAYVADKLARSIDNDFEMEALKAQAVLIRSGLLAAGDGRDMREIRVEDTGYGDAAVTENLLEAVEETAGVCLVYNDRPVNGAYFAVSNGATRNGDELLPEEYPYMKSALCERDFLSPDYSSAVVYTDREFEEIWQEIPAVKIMEEEILENEKITAEREMEDFGLYRDSADYVLYVERAGRYVTGEQFRDAFYLKSASFHLEKEDGQIRISVKGVGHGFGMSQFGANEMAKEGDDYVKILKYFFQDATITKFE